MINVTHLTSDLKLAQTQKAEALQLAASKPSGAGHGAGDVFTMEQFKEYEARVQEKVRGILETYQRQLDGVRAHLDDLQGQLAGANADIAYWTQCWENLPEEADPEDSKFSTQHKDNYGPSPLKTCSSHRRGL